MMDLNTFESSEAPNSSRPVSNLKTLIAKKLTRTASELPMNKSLSIFSATIPGTKFINLRRASNDHDNSPGLSSKLNTQNDDNEKSPEPRTLKKSMSSTMGNFRQRSTTASPESPFAMNSKSSSPNKRRTFTSAIRINPTRPFTREARASSRWSPMRGSPLVGSPTNNKSNESVSFAVMKVQEIITDCCRLTQNNPERAKNKAKEEEEEAEQEKSAKAFDFWKKDLTFLEERAKMRVELQKYKDANQVKKKKGPNFLEEVEKDNKHEDEEERNNGDNKEANEPGKGNIEQNDDISKFILQKPRTFYVKTLPASVRKQLRLMQGPAQPVPTEEDKPLEKIEKIEPEVPKPVSQKVIGSSPGIKEVSIDLEKTQSTEKRFRSHSKDQVNESVVAKTEEAERVSSPVIIRKTQDLPRQATKSFDKSPAKSDHSRKIETSLKKETKMLGETISKWNEKVEISPKQKVSFLAYKRGDYRKRVVAVHQMYKSATFLKNFTQ